MFLVLQILFFSSNLTIRIEVDVDTGSSGTPGIIVDTKCAATIVAAGDLIGCPNIRSSEKGIAVAPGTRLAPGSIKTFCLPRQSRFVVLSRRPQELHTSIQPCSPLFWRGRLHQSLSLCKNHSRKHGVYGPLPTLIVLSTCHSFTRLLDFFVYSFNFFHPSHHSSNVF